MNKLHSTRSSILKNFIQYIAPENPSYIHETLISPLCRVNGTYMFLLKYITTGIFAQVKTPQTIMNTDELYVNITWPFENDKKQT